MDDLIYHFFSSITWEFNYSCYTIIVITGIDKKNIVDFLNRLLLWLPSIEMRVIFHPFWLYIDQKIAILLVVKHHETELNTQETDGGQI